MGGWVGGWVGGGKVEEIEAVRMRCWTCRGWVWVGGWRRRTYLPHEVLIDHGLPASGPVLAHVALAVHLGGEVGRWVGLGWVWSGWVGGWVDVPGYH